MKSINKLTQRDLIWVFLGHLEYEGEDDEHKGSGEARHSTRELVLLLA